MKLSDLTFTRITDPFKTPVIFRSQPLVYVSGEHVYPTRVIKRLYKDNTSLYSLRMSEGIIWQCDEFEIACILHDCTEDIT